MLFGPAMGDGRDRTFSIKLRAIPMGVMRPELDDGGKLILPPRALGLITQYNLQYPLLFQVSNPKYTDRVTHAGVLEFTAEEGRCYIPHWMMQAIRLEPNDMLQIHSRTLQAANFVRLQPQSVDFLDITNPKAVLEQKLRNYAALTKGDTILFKYNEKDYFLKVLEIQPDTHNHAVSIIETDVKVDFAPPVGYKEPERPKPAPTPAAPVVDKNEVDPSQVLDESDESAEEEQFTAFAGTGARISGKKVDSPSVASALAKKDAEKQAREERKPVIAANGELVYKSNSELDDLRRLQRERFEARQAQQTKAASSSDAKEGFIPFGGPGHRMK